MGGFIERRSGLTGSMTTLLLVPANKSRGGDFWPADDFDVRDEGRRVVGRIMVHPQAPKERPWFWTIVEGIPMSIYNRGYAASREDAMADFKNRWVSVR
jgi:hypothetical protein